MNSKSETTDAQPEAVDTSPNTFFGMITEITNQDSAHQSPPPNDYKKKKVAKMPIGIRIEPGLTSKTRLFLRVVRESSGGLVTSSVVVMTIPFARKYPLDEEYFGDIKTDDAGVINGAKYFELYENYNGGSFSNGVARSWEFNGTNYTHYNSTVRFEIT